MGTRIVNREGKRKFDKERHFRLVRWDVTSRCNLRCKHCRSGHYFGPPDRDDNNYQELTSEDALNVVDRLCQGNVKELYFLGGEPFLRKDIFSILEKAVSLGMTVLVSTNGTLLDRLQINRLAELNLWTINFSLDGPDAATHDIVRGAGSFNLALQTIDYLQERLLKSGSQTTITLTTVLLRSNFANAEKMLNLTDTLGIRHIGFSKADIVGYMERNRELLELSPEELLEISRRIAQASGAFPDLDVNFQFAKPKVIEYLNHYAGTQLPLLYRNCNAIVREAFLEPDGSLFPCFFITDRGPLEKEGVLKSERLRLTNKSLEEIWHSPSFREAHHILHHNDSDARHTKYRPCNDCRLFGVLCVPCPIFGCLKQSEIIQPLCELVRKQVPEIFYNVN